MDIINKFYIESIEKDKNQVIFFMEDTYNFEVWLLDFEISYTMKHFVDGSLDQVIISIEDYSKIEKYVFTDDKKAEILKVIIKDIFGIEGAFVDELAKQNVDIVFVGEMKDPNLYTIGNHNGEVVSIESEGLLKIFNAIKMILEQ
ncbi:hypothetical protein [uncultured Methanobrevibacter sp.]|uniref:hypothetical protein n=1 Tax=uncultured Methanobrevibacter sp. TaxID=253161 RepID=UPI0025DAF9B1|nr:hypothetical protein [uncultured Methanobrevibacter sp.]